MNDSNPSHNFALRAEHVTKSFKGITVLHDFAIHVRPGETHALVGENGSGKSTFIKILAGFHRPDSGSSVEIAGRTLPWGAPDASYSMGCRFVHQDLGLVPASTVLDNLSFVSGYPTRAGTIRTKMARIRAREDLARVGLDLDPDTPVSELTPAVRTGVAIARALKSDSSAPPHVLVLDEPTATLPEDDVSRLADLLRSVTSEGIGVVYVTHRIHEIFSLADSITVVRDGNLVVTRPVAGLDYSEVLELLVGNEIIHATREGSSLMREPTVETDIVLTVRGLCAGPLKTVDLEIRAGTITGIAGITGSGRETVLSAIYGGSRRTSGDVEVTGQPVEPGRPDRARAMGMVYLPPDRKFGGGFMNLSASENLLISDLHSVSRHGRVIEREAQTQASSWMSRLRVSPAISGKHPLKLFSGGNQQKILFAKWLRARPVMFLLDEPTQGVDVGAKAVLHHELVSAARDGMSILIASSDIDELAALCSRVIVLQAGRVVAELRGNDVTETGISRACLGALK